MEKNAFCFLLIFIPLCFIPPSFSSESPDDFYQILDGFHTLGGPPVTTSNRLAKRETSFEDQWFDQILDHTDLTNNNTWKQRYWVNFDHFNEANDDSPIFLNLAGEYDAKRFTYIIRDGSMANNGARFRAAMIFLEHRYYGRSRPTR